MKNALKRPAGDYRKLYDFCCGEKWASRSGNCCALHRNLLSLLVSYLRLSLFFCHWLTLSHKIVFSVTTTSPRKSVIFFPGDDCTTVTCTDPGHAAVISRLSDEAHIIQLLHRKFTQRTGSESCEVCLSYDTFFSLYDSNVDNFRRLKNSSKIQTSSLSARLRLF